MKKYFKNFLKDFFLIKHDFIDLKERKYLQKLQKHFDDEFIALYVIIKRIQSSLPFYLMEFSEIFYQLLWPYNFYFIGIYRAYSIDNDKDRKKDKQPDRTIDRSIYR